MFPNTIEDLTDGTTDHDYDLRSINGSQTIRADIAATQNEPATLTISHSKSGTGESQVQNSLVRFDRTVSDADGNQGVISAYLVLRNPVKTATAAQVLQVIKQLVDLLNTGTNATMVINGEI